MADDDEHRFVTTFTKDMDHVDIEVDSESRWLQVILIMVISYESSKKPGRFSRYRNSKHNTCIRFVLNEADINYLTNKEKLMVCFTKLAVDQPYRLVTNNEPLTASRSSLLHSLVSVSSSSSSSSSSTDTKRAVKSDMPFSTFGIGSGGGIGSDGNKRHQEAVDYYGSYECWYMSSRSRAYIIKEAISKLQAQTIGGFSGIPRDVIKLMFAMQGKQRERIKGKFYMDTHQHVNETTVFKLWNDYALTGDHSYLPISDNIMDTKGRHRLVLSQEEVIKNVDWKPSCIPLIIFQLCIAYCDLFSIPSRYIDSVVDNTMNMVYHSMNNFDSSTPDISLVDTLDRMDKMEWSSELTRVPFQNKLRLLEKYKQKTYLVYNILQNALPQLITVSDKQHIAHLLETVAYNNIWHNLTYGTTTILPKLWEYITRIDDEAHYTRYRIEIMDAQQMIGLILGSGYILAIHEEYTKLAKRYGDLIYLQIKGADPMVVKCSLMISGINTSDFIVVPYHNSEADIHTRLIINRLSWFHHQTKAVVSYLSPYTALSIRQDRKVQSAAKLYHQTKLRKISRLSISPTMASLSRLTDHESKWHMINILRKLCGLKRLESIDDYPTYVMVTVDRVMNVLTSVNRNLGSYTIQQLCRLIGLILSFHESDSAYDEVENEADCDFSPDSDDKQESSSSEFSSRPTSIRLAISGYQVDNIHSILSQIKKESPFRVRKGWWYVKLIIDSVFLSNVLDGERILEILSTLEKEINISNVNIDPVIVSYVNEDCEHMNTPVRIRYQRQHGRPSSLFAPLFPSSNGHDESCTIGDNRAYRFIVCVIPILEQFVFNAAVSRSKKVSEMTHWFDLPPSNEPLAFTEFSCNCNRSYPICMFSSNTQINAREYIDRCFYGLSIEGNSKYPGWRRLYHVTKWVSMFRSIDVSLGSSININGEDDRKVTPNTPETKSSYSSSSSSSRLVPLTTPPPPRPSSSISSSKTVPSITLKTVETIGSSSSSSSYDNRAIYNSRDNRSSYSHKRHNNGNSRYSNN